MIREPIVQGKFYPSSQEAIDKMIEGFSLDQSSKISAKGIIVPHAGYQFSGKVAATTISKVIPKKRIILLGPNHTGYGKNFSLWANDSWKVPSGDIMIDSELAKDILSCGSTIQEDRVAHQFEHSIEVELPILHHFFGDFKFVPIICQVSDCEAYRRAALQITDAIAHDKEDVLMVASTDMTHYEPEAQARKKDRDAIASIIDLDEEKLIATVKKDKITMCGLAPVAILLAALKILGAHKAQVALYQTSGEASGDYTSVVGYAGIIVQ